MSRKNSKPSPEVLERTPECACLNLRMAARSVTQMYDEVLKPAGLKATQFSVLAAVATEGPASMTAISDALVMDRTTLTRNLQPLLDRGLVETGAVDDRRKRTVALTAKGRDVLAGALPLWQEAQGHVVAAIGLARWQGVTQMLRETVRLTR